MLAAFAMGCATTLGIAWWSWRDYVGSAGSRALGFAATEMGFMFDTHSKRLWSWSTLEATGSTYCFAGSMFEVHDPRGPETVLEQTGKAELWPSAGTGISPEFLRANADSLARVECTVVGWPFRCLRAMWLQRSDQPLSTQYVIEGLGRAEYEDPVPTHILWTGVLINTTLAFPLWFALLSAPHLLRARHRRRHGLCAACAYDLQGLPPKSPCPECGKSRAPIPANRSGEH